MNLVIDVGNTQIFGGVFDKEKLLFTFRKSSKNDFSSDEFGIFLKSVIRENLKKEIKDVKSCVSSVVPRLNYTLRNSIIKYFETEPLFVSSGIKTGINIKYKNPSDVGADRITNCIGAIKLYGSGNYIIIDMGTATTFDILTEKKEYLGGLIIPGPKIQTESLFLNTAKLPSIEIKPMENIDINNTNGAIQSGIYFLNYYGIYAITEKIKKDFFKDKTVKVIGTGGFSRIYEKSKIFDITNGDLTLYGLNEIIKINSEE